VWRVIPQARGFREHALLRDGSWVLLRVAGPDDVPAVRDLLERVSPTSRRLRFFGGVGQVSPAWIEELCRPPDRDRACLLAVWGEGEAARVVGVGNYVALPGRNTAEVAFLVDDAFQGRGIGTLLLERLAGIAAGQGLVGFEADVLAENRLMVEVFRESGFQVRQALEGGTLHVEFPVSGSAAAWERAELRERIATANSLVPLLRPRTVAVVGASRDPDSIGGMVFRYALAAGFTGTIYPVNREASSVHGVRAYPSVEALPEPVDLAIVAVPAPEVIGVARACVRAGTRALVVLTAGFAESGPEGAARQRELVETVRAWGARMLGPNCMGLINTDPRVRLNASLAPELAPRGRIGFFSHSGALGLAILSYAAERGLGFSTFVSAGNRADVSGNDLLAYWDEDPETDLVMLYLETFGNPRRFARLARRVSARKPVLCVKSARSPAGSRAAAAHIGATTQGDVEVDALFRQAGVIRADTLEEMFDVAVLLAHQPLPAGRGVAIVSNSGGVATICADACEARGLVVSGRGVVDLGPLAGASAYETAVLEALTDPSVDAVIAIFACVAGCDPEAVARAIRRAAVRAERRVGLAKPVLLCRMGEPRAVQVAGHERPFPAYRFPESAAIALARAAEYAAYRRRPPGRLVFFDDVDGTGARRLVEGWLAGAGEGEVEPDGSGTRRLMAAFGMPVEDGGPDGDLSGALRVRVRQDATFGPLLEVEAGSARWVRITPLTDRDARELVEAARPGWRGAEEALLRLSQMVEELPWLARLEAVLRPHGDGVRWQDVRLGLRGGLHEPPPPVHT